MTPILIDTHAHLDDERFHGDLPQVLDRARAAGVVNILTVATTADSSAASVNLAQRHDMLFATVGIQPNHVAQEPADAWDQVLALIGRQRVVGLGETGLDRHWSYTPFDQQEEFFARHLEQSRRTGLPLVIHSRDCDADMVRMLREDFDRHGPIRGVMHSFASDQATAEAFLDMGLYLSFSGMITQQPNEGLRQVAARVPLSRLLVETDSPYLVPRGVQGRRNEPAHVVHTARVLSQVQGIELDTLAAHTTANARQLFRLGEAA